MGLAVAALLSGRGAKPPFRDAVPELSARLDDGDGLDLDQEIRVRKSPYLDRRAGRQSRAEILHSHVDMPEEFVDIGGEGLGAHEIGQGRPGRGEGGRQVLADLADLRTRASK